MSIKDSINDDLKNAMRAKDKQTLNALRLVMAAVKQIEVDERIDVDDARMLVILDKLAKQRQESIQQFKAANRTDLIAQEEFELKLISHYLPEPLAETEISELIAKAFAAVNAQSMADMGKIMSHLKPLIQGRADMGKVSAIIKAKLSTL